MLNCIETKTFAKWKQRKMNEANKNFLIMMKQKEVYFRLKSQIEIVFSGRKEHEKFVEVIEVEKKM
jgi:hypothetical protein